VKLSLFPGVWPKIGHFSQKCLQQKLVRHSDVRTTLNIYGTAFTADMRQAHEKIVKLALTDRKVDREVAN
jgi:hypothetical protein